MDDQSRERLQQGLSPIENLHRPCLYPNPTNKRGFNYHPLRSASHHIRILRLHKGPLYDPIQCSLISMPLGSEKCCYQALSYAWGDLHDLVPIQVDGFRFQVTRNLKSALQHLRQPDADMDLWVDAVCIDQDPSDNKEKSSQVTLMTEIYRSATQVLIWLGPASEDSDLIMHFFDEEGKQLYDGLDEISVDRTVLFDSERTKPLDERCNSLRSRLFDPNESRLRRSLESLFRRSYWERVWVVQEIITAKSINILCGLSSAQYNHVMAILSEFHSELKNAKASTHHGTHGHRKNPAQEKLLEKLLVKLTDTPARSLIEKLTKLRRTPKVEGFPSVGTAILRHHPTMMTPLNIARERLLSRKKRDPNWLQEMLKGLRHLKSSNPKDKIFSLMGIISPNFQTGDHVVPINYDLSLLQISLHLFKFCTSCDNKSSLNIIAASQPSSDNSFPSWLPDFSKDNGMVAWPLLRITGRRLKNNLANDVAPHFLDSGKTLAVNARVVATITGVTGDEDDPLATDRISLLVRIRSSLAVAQRIGSVDGGILEYFWQVLAMDVETKSHRLPRSLESLDESLKAWETFQEKDYIREFRRMSYGRRFASITPEKPLRSLDSYERFSMCPSGCHEGDLICQLPRCDYLVVLRSDNVHGTFHTFIGPCYTPSLEYLVRFSDSAALPQPQQFKIR